MLEDTLTAQLRDRILPELGLTTQNLKGLMVYGSRVTGGSREKSDLDVLGWIENGDAGFEAEYHGSDLEIRLQTNAIIQKSIEESVVRASAIQSGKILIDTDGTLQRLKESARLALVERGHDLLQSVQMSAGQLRTLIGISTEETIQVVTELLPSRPLAAHARLCEFLGEFRVYTEMFFRKNAKNGNQTTQPFDLPTVLSAESRPARMLDIGKYSAATWFENLYRNIEAILFHCPQMSDSHRAGALRQVFESAFRRRTGESYESDTEVWIPFSKGVQS